MTEECADDTTLGGLELITMPIHLFLVSWESDQPLGDPSARAFEVFLKVSQSVSQDQPPTHDLKLFTVSKGGDWAIPGARTIEAF